MNNESPDLSGSVVKPKRRLWLVGLIAVAVIALCVCLVVGGFFGYQTYTTSQTQTAVVLGSTATSHQQATGTQVAVVTGTAASKATAKAIAGATSTTRYEQTATTIVKTTATAQVLLASVGSIVPSNWGVWRYDDFSEAGDWDLSPVSDRLGNAKYAIQSGELVWDLTSKDGVIWWQYPSRFQLKDFYLSADFRGIEGTANSYDALVFRHGNDVDSYYEFDVADNGYYELEMSAPKKDYTTLRSGYTKAAKRNGTNILAVRAIGDEFTLYVNHTEIAKVKDSTYTQGSLALGFWQPYGGIHSKIAFDNFLVLAPP